MINVHGLCISQRKKNISQILKTKEYKNILKIARLVLGYFQFYQILGLKGVFTARVLIDRKIEQYFGYLKS